MTLLPKEMNAEIAPLPVHLLMFRLDQQTFALSIEHITQIIPMLKLTDVPQIQQMIEGVANIHGMVVPVLSARRFLGMPQQAPDLDTPIILCQVNNHNLGLIVDEVLDVINILETQIAPTQSLLPDALNTTRAINGIIYHDGHSILLLSPQFLLNPGQFRNIEQVIQALPPLPTPEIAPVEEFIFEDVYPTDTPVVEDIVVAVESQPVEPAAVVVETTPLDVEVAKTTLVDVEEVETIPVDVEAAVPEPTDPEILPVPATPVEGNNGHSSRKTKKRSKNSGESAKPSRRKNQEAAMNEKLASMSADLPPTEGDPANENDTPTGSQQEGLA